MFFYEDSLSLEVVSAVLAEYSLSVRDIRRPTRLVGYDVSAGWYLLLKHRDPFFRQHLNKALSCGGNVAHMHQSLELEESTTLDDPTDFQKHLSGSHDYIHDKLWNL